MAKKYLKILLINIIIIVLIVLSIEFILIYSTFKAQNWGNASFKLHALRQFQSYFTYEYFDINKDFRSSSYTKISENKAPIAVMGCSFVYGYKLEDDETFSAQLSKYTERPVYNLGVIGTSPRDILYILENDNLRNSLIKEAPEYIIYPYISHHLARLYTDIRFYKPCPYYRYKDGKLEYYRKNSLIINSQIYRKILELKYKKVSDDEAFSLFCIYMKQINEEIKKHYPNAKFVILVYEDNVPDTHHNWDLLKDYGITVLNASEITGEDIYTTPYFVAQNDTHPNAKAWAAIVPALSKELNL